MCRKVSRVVADLLGATVVAGVSQIVARCLGRLGATVVANLSQVVAVVLRLDECDNSTP